MKISEAFEGPNSSLRKTFDNVPMPTQPTDERVEKVVKEFAVEWINRNLNENTNKRSEFVTEFLSSLLADCEARVREEVSPLVNNDTKESYMRGFEDGTKLVNEALRHIISRDS